MNYSSYSLDVKSKSKARVNYGITLDTYIYHKDYYPLWAHILSLRYIISAEKDNVLPYFPITLHHIVSFPDSYPQLPIVLNPQQPIRKGVRRLSDKRNLCINLLLLPLRKACPSLQPIRTYPDTHRFRRADDLIVRAMQTGARRRVLTPGNLCIKTISSAGFGMFFSGGLSWQSPSWEDVNRR